MKAQKPKNQTRLRLGYKSANFGYRGPTHTPIIKSILFIIIIIYLYVFIYFIAVGDKTLNASLQGSISLFSESDAASRHGVAANNRRVR